MIVCYQYKNRSNNEVVFIEAIGYEFEDGTVRYFAKRPINDNHYHLKLICAWKIKNKKDTTHKK